MQSIYAAVSYFRPLFFILTPQELHQAAFDIVV